MKKLLAIMMMVLPMLATAQDASATKNEWLYYKNSGLSSNDNMEQFALFCKITYNGQFQPTDYYFVFRAQNDKYEMLEDRFVIYSGDAQGMYDTLSSCQYFAKNNREDGVKFTTGGVSMMNYNLKLFGWYTQISIGTQRHDFKEKDFKKMLEKFEDFCKKRNIPINKTSQRQQSTNQ